MAEKSFEIAIIGGSAAGLSAALVLGRSRREVIVIDDGNPRNAQADYSHGVFMSDGMPPGHLTRTAREQLKPYHVELCDGKVVSALRFAGGFKLGLQSGEELQAKKLLFATGIQDKLPDIPGLKTFWGKSIFSCPYCDGWEFRDKRLVVIGPGKKGFEFILLIRQWSKDVTLCTNDGPQLAKELLDHLEKLQVQVITGKVTGVVPGRNSKLVLQIDDCEPTECDGIFMEPECFLRNELVEQLGCKFDKTGKRLEVDGKGRTTEAGIYAAGDIATLHSQITIAAASGVEAAFTINHDMVEESMFP